MNKIVRNLRLLIFVELLGLIYYLIPDDAIRTHKWIAQLPFEE